MSTAYPATLNRRWTVQLTLALGAAVSLGMAVYEARAEDAASLLANPKRMELVQAGCRTNQPWATPELCRDAAEAIRQRFRGAGVRYTPRRMKPSRLRPRAARPADRPVPAPASTQPDRIF